MWDIDKLQVHRIIDRYSIFFIVSPGEVRSSAGRWTHDRGLQSANAAVTQG